MARKERTDPHRPGAIIPAHYEPVLSFSLASSEGGWPVPSYRINCVLDGHFEVGPDGKQTTTWIPGTHGTGSCCVIRLRELGMTFALGGGPGKCTVCGAHYVHGDAWRHIPTGEIVFLGHDCAAKYEMLMDRSAYELEMGRRRAATARMAEQARRDELEKAFCEAHPGMAEAFGVEHAIIADLRGKLRQYGDLSDKQVALALKIAGEIKNPQESAKEVTVPAPTGKTTFRGVVVSKKRHEGSFGDTTKITVKVTTPEGVWLAWGTAPAGLYDFNGARASHDGEMKGSEVELTATLKAGRDAHFALMSRPRGKIVRRTCSDKCRGCERERMGAEAFELKEAIELWRRDELAARERGLFTKAVWCQSQADEAERLGRLPAADDSLWSSGYLWMRTLESDSPEKYA